MHFHNLFMSLNTPEKLCVASHHLVSSQKHSNKYKAMISLDFFMFLPSKTMVFLGFPVKHCLCKSTILRHGYRGAGGAAGAT